MAIFLKQARWFGYIQALMLLVLATVIGIFLRPFVAPANLVMLYLLVVVVAAVRWGYGSAVLCSSLSVLLFNFFFVPHQYTLRVEDAQYLLTFAGLFVVGMVIADLTNRVRQQAEMAHLREAQTAELYALSRDLVATINLDTILSAVQTHIHDTFHAEVAIFINQENHLTCLTRTPNYLSHDCEQDVMQWVFNNAQSAGCGQANWSEYSSLCVPLRTVHENIGVLALQIESHQAQRHEYKRLIDAFANQSALAIEAAKLASEAQKAQLFREREALHTAVLNSISHDLRTPLVSIAGTLSTLRDDTIQYTEETKRDLLDGAWLETQRLNRIVANLLDMSRLQTGMLQLKRDWYDVDELIALARSQLSSRLKDRPLKVDLAPRLPLIQFDLTFMGQVLTNLLDNALKYSEEGTLLEIRASVTENWLTLEVLDEGAGIPEDDLPHIFETFYRARRTGGIGGTGLGLSICDGIVTAHHGKLEAENRPEGGALFRIKLPILDTLSPQKAENIAYES